MPARSGTSSSSMNTAASFSSSWIDGSPSRQSPARNGVRTPRGSLVKDPYDSPSRERQLEFNLMLSRSDRDFNERLDQATAERAKIYNEQLAKAALEHERIQEGAKLEIQRLLLEQEQERVRREEAQRREVERLHQEKARQEAEAQRRKLEAKQREEEAARQSAERQKQLQETEAKLRAQKEREAAAERQKKEQEEIQRKAKEAAIAAQRAQAQQQAPQSSPAPVPTTSAVKTPSTSTPAATAGVEELHNKYLELHKRMKAFRVAFQNHHKQKGQPLKEAVGDARRNIRKRMGQITVERKDSVAAIARLREEGFNKALETPGPMVDIRPFIVSHQIPPLASEAEAQYPALLLYVWICFEKSVLKQFEKEAANEEGRIIQEIGLITASLLADQRYMWKGIPMTDILLAKLHLLCPILFGVRGTMKTAAGQLRLGWMSIDKGPPSLNSYAQRMKGLGAGYAALSLRQFSGKNPAIPMSEFWRAVVSICNTPSEDLWPGHFEVLTGLLRDYAKKFVTFYGVPARAVLVKATRDLPVRAPKRLEEAARAVSVLPTKWKEEGLALD